MVSTIDDFGKSTTTINKIKVNDKEIQKSNEEIKKISHRYNLKKQANIRKSLKLFKLKNTLFLNSSNRKSMEKAIKEGKNSFTLVLPKKGIQKFINKNMDTLTLASLVRKKSNSIDDAMLSTNVDPYALNYSNRRGNNIGIFMVEAGNDCPQNNELANYMRIGNVTGVNNHARLVAKIMREVSPNSYIYCKGDGADLPNNSDRSGHNGHPSIFVQNYSFAWDIDDEHYGIEYTQKDADYDNEVIDHNQIVIVAAGNNHDLKIASPGKGFNVITVGNYNDATDKIETSSCYGDPQTSIHKPELSAPGKNIKVGNLENSGTSFSAPHVAGFAADLLSRYSWLRLRPAYFKAYLLASATKSITGGADKVGLGGLDFYDSVYNGQHSWWRGSFDYWKKHDGGTIDSKIERTIYLSAGRDIRAVISWLNDGDYTLAHRNANRPMGKDYDFSVYAPNGSFIDDSNSWENSYEVVNFHTNVSGNYKFIITEFVDRDSATAMHLGLSVSW